MSNDEANERGAYVLATVKPGTYRLEATADGFARFARDGLDLHVDQRARLNVTLAVGHRMEDVTVTGTGPLLRMSDGSLGTVIDRHLAENLPLNGRSFSALIALVPGVVTTQMDGTWETDYSPSMVNARRRTISSLTVSVRTSA